MTFDRLGGPSKVLRQVAAFIALGLAAGQGVQAAPGCEIVTGVLACQNLGQFLASATRVTLSRKDGSTTYVGVPTMVRFQNVSDRPLILAYRVGSQKVTDDKGLVYNWNRGSYELKSIAGIGLVTRDSADPQFVLAPGGGPRRVVRRRAAVLDAARGPGHCLQPRSDHRAARGRVGPPGPHRARPRAELREPGAGRQCRRKCRPGRQPRHDRRRRVRHHSDVTPATAAAPATGAQPADVAIKLMELIKQKR